MDKDHLDIGLLYIIIELHCIYLIVSNKVTNIQFMYCVLQI